MGTLINSLPPSLVAGVYPPKTETFKSLTPPKPHHHPNGDHLFVRHFHERDRLIREHQLKQQQLRDVEEILQEQEQELEPEPELEPQQPQEAANQLEHNHHWHGVVCEGRKLLHIAPPTAAAAVQPSVPLPLIPEKEVLPLPISSSSETAMATTVPPKDLDIYEQATPNGRLCRPANKGKFYDQINCFFSGMRG